MEEKRRKLRKDEQKKGEDETRERRNVGVGEKEQRGKGMPPFMLRTYDVTMCENTTTGSWRPPPDLAAVARFQLWLAAPFNTRLYTGRLMNPDKRSVIDH